MKVKAYNEIRLDKKGNLDDIVINDIHLEDMDNHLWWLGIYNKRTKKRTTFHITSKSPITVELIENGLNTKIIPWDDDGGGD